MTYFARHWRGELPLWLAFWVNGVILWLLRDFVDAGWSPIRWITSQDMDRLVVAPLYAVLYFALTLWSLHGIGRALVVARARRTPGIGHMVMRMLTLYQRVSMWMFLFVSVLVIWNTITPVRIGDTEYVYTLDRPWYGAIRVKGPITFGMPGDLRAAIEADPDIHTLIFNSPGGMYDEALLIRDLVIANKLNVEVEHQCNSACTLVLVAASKGVLQEGANVGFHRISLGDQATTFLNSLVFAKWLVDDTNLLKEHGVPTPFVRRAHNTPFDELWLPSVRELVDAGYVDEVNVEGVTYTPGEYCAIRDCNRSWYLRDGEWQRITPL